MRLFKRLQGWILTLGDLLEEYLRAKEGVLSQGTLSRLPGLISKPMQLGSGYRLRQLTPELLDGLYRSCVDTDETTWYWYNKSISGMLAYAVERGYISTNPSLELKYKRKRRIKGKAYSHETIKKVLAVASPKMRIAILLAVNLGLRPGEVAGLKWSDIDFEKKTIDVGRSIASLKGGRLVVNPPKTEGSVMMSDELSVILKKWPRKSEYVIDGPHNGHINPRWLSNQWIGIREKTGIKGRFYDLRHTQASHLIASGTDLATVANRMRHSTPKTTLAYYTHMIGGKDKEAANKAVFL